MNNLMDIEELNRQFKKIQEICLKEGILIPKIIPLDLIDEKNRLSASEIKKLGVSERSKDKLFEAYKERRKMEYAIFKNRDKKFKNYEDYYMNEWEVFQKQFMKD